MTIHANNARCAPASSRHRKKKTHLNSRGCSCSLILCASICCPRSKTSPTKIIFWVTFFFFFFLRLFVFWQRLKIGEAVVLSARRCGEAMPKYAHYYVNAFVAAARERQGATEGAEGPPAAADALEGKERSHFRASCLSNLAEVCQLLRWSLGRFSQVLHWNGGGGGCNG